MKIIVALLLTLIAPRLEAHSHPSILSDLPHSSAMQQDVSGQPAYIRLSSAGSVVWQQGLFFNRSNQDLTIPFVGVAALKADAAQGRFSWSVDTKDLGIEKSAFVLVERKSDGCEMSWWWTVTNGGKDLIREKGSLRYDCSSGRGSHDPRPSLTSHSNLRDQTRDYLSPKQSLTVTNR